MSESKLNDIIETSLNNIRAIADSNTIIGDPISTNGGTVIIPVSKVSLGFASGGADYLPKNGKNDSKSSDSLKTLSAAVNTQAGKPVNGKTTNFAGGNGTGITVTPVCFLIVKENGNVDMLNVNSPAATSPAVGVVDSVSSFLEGAPDLITKFKDAFAKNKKSDENLDSDSLKEDIENLKK